MKTLLTIAALGLSAISSPAQQEADAQALRDLIVAAKAGQLPALPQGQATELGVPDIGPCKSIWSATMVDIQQLWFRRTFEVPKGATKGKIVFSCDNRCTVFFNGEEIATADDWEKLTVADLGDQLRKGKNVIAIHARNEGSCAALVAWVVWQDDKGAAAGISTSKEWKVCEAEEAGWQQADHDDSLWADANETGETPFGHNVHRGTPRGIVFQNAFMKAADRIEAALAAFRSAGDLDAAQRALDAIDRAVMDSRTAIWKACEAAKQKGAAKAR